VSWQRRERFSLHRITAAGVIVMGDIAPMCITVITIIVQATAAGVVAAEISGRASSEV